MTPLEQDLIEENDELRKRLYQIETCFSQAKQLRKFGFQVSANKLWAVIDEVLKIVKQKSH